MAGEDLDIRLFIGKVKAYPVIWNTLDEGYADRTKKRAAWKNICRTFVENFDEKSEREQDDAYEKLSKKWKNLKDNFAKSQKKQTKSGRAANSSRKYIYAKQLSFLTQAGAVAETDSSFLEDESNNQNTQDDFNDASECEASDDAKVKIPPRYISKSMNHAKDAKFESALIDFIKAQAPVAPEPNPDRAFFESLLPIVEKFSEDEKLDFRSQVLELVKSIRKSRAVSPTTPHYYAGTHRYRVTEPAQRNRGKRGSSSRTRFPSKVYKKEFDTELIIGEQQPDALDPEESEYLDEEYLPE
ncbi:uncharacterized protein LOC109405708 [Aedes albopictus]|uniref:MADF domain-containing protein n=1 Tax=Aedes albopictus TaxID=7160 RepID=A0ABM1YQB7_AEDAL